MSVLAPDVGMTGVTALVVSEQGQVLRRGYPGVPAALSRTRLVEHEPEEIWQAVLAATRTALGGATSKDGRRCCGSTSWDDASASAFC